MWDSLLESGNAERLTFSPEMGWGRGPLGGPGLEPWGGGVGQSPFPPPQLSLGPCFLCLLALPLRTAGWNHVPPSPAPPRPCWREWPGLLAPATYGLLFCCPGLSRWRLGGRGQRLLPGSLPLVLGVTESHLYPCVMG